jgi:8-oxo-dGTP diphosphatase
MGTSTQFRFTQLPNIMTSRPRPELCVGAVVTRPGAEAGDPSELLLIQRANPPQQGRWSLPGGRVEHGETLHDAVIREVLEETGVEIRVGGLIEAVERISDEFHFVIMDYFAEPVHLSAIAQCATDAADAQWFPAPEVAALDLADLLLEFLLQHGVVASG